MSASDKLFAGSIPEIYDTLLVPLIFEAFAEDLARRAAALSPRSVLETAAGTGVLTRALAPKLNSDARYVVTDLNQPMLDYAEKKQPPDERIEWRQADALQLPFDDKSFDAVCCQFGVMFFPDRVAGYKEARRALKPGGNFLFNAWDRIEENELANTVTEALASLFPTDPPRFLARTPHGYHDTAVIRDDLGRAGFSGIAIATVAEVGRAPSPIQAATALCQGSPLRYEIEARDAGGVQLATERAADAIGRRYGNGPLACKIQAHVVVATA
jgi:SAM-dependent methyltransferase